jgi:hypothetical protein
MCRLVREWVSCEGEVAEECSSRWIALLGHASRGPSRQNHNRRVLRNAQRAAVSTSVNKQVSRGGDAADKRSRRSIGMLGHVCDGPSGQIHNRRIRRNTQRVAVATRPETSFARRIRRR